MTATVFRGTSRKVRTMASDRPQYAGTVGANPLPGDKKLSRMLNSKKWQRQTAKLVAAMEGRNQMAKRISRATRTNQSGKRYNYAKAGTVKGGQVRASGLRGGKLRSQTRSAKAIGLRGAVRASAAMSSGRGGGGGGAASRG